MKIDLSFVSNDWLRGVLADAVVQKADALLQWSKNKELELQSDIAAELENGTTPSEVANVKLEKLCERYERQQHNTVEIEDALKHLIKQTGTKPTQRINTSDAVARAKQLLAKK